MSTKTVEWAFSVQPDQAIDVLRKGIGAIGGKPTVSGRELSAAIPGVIARGRSEWLVTVSPIEGGSMARLTLEASEGRHEKLLDNLFRQCWASVTARGDRSADLIAAHQAQSTKIEPHIEIDRVPRTDEERRVLLQTRPGEWEWLLFGSVLLKEKRALEAAWRNASPRKPFPPGTVPGRQGSPRLPGQSPLADRADRDPPRSADVLPDAEPGVRQDG